MSGGNLSSASREHIGACREWGEGQCLEQVGDQCQEQVEGQCQSRWGVSAGTPGSRGPQGPRARQTRTTRTTRDKAGVGSAILPTGLARPHAWWPPQSWPAAVVLFFLQEQVGRLESNRRPWVGGTECSLPPAGGQLQRARVRRNHSIALVFLVYSDLSPWNLAQHLRYTRRQLLGRDQ